MKFASGVIKINAQYVIYFVSDDIHMSKLHGSERNTSHHIPSNQILHIHILSKRFVKSLHICDVIVDGKKQCFLFWIYEKSVKKTKWERNRKKNWKATTKKIVEKTMLAWSLHVGFCVFYIFLNNKYNNVIVSHFITFCSVLERISWKKFQHDIQCSNHDL